MQQKKAIILYRCSTDRQDLQAQQDTCRKFCYNKGFMLLDEYMEEGVSGYKVSLAERNELLEILSRAENKEFDVLIVFMFDRLGRSEDETPFIIQQLKEYGVDIYTASDGNIISSITHEDKLMNYFQSWIAQYESIKTSIRIKNKFSVMNKNGEFTGGMPPFGYETYQTGEIKENGKMKYNLRINESEAKIVKIIFELAYNKGFGATRIANYLNEHGYRCRTIHRKNKDGIKIPTDGMFKRSSVGKILRNPVYIGHKRYNVCQNYQDKVIYNSRNDWKLKDHRDDLKLIDEHIFIKVNKDMDTRYNPEKGTDNLPTKSKLLCTGFAFCHCGCKLKADYSIKHYTRKSDGQKTTTHTYRYVCNSGLSNKKEHGSSSYSAKKYDMKIEKLIISFMQNLDINKLRSEIDKFKTESVNRLASEITELTKSNEQCYKIIQKYEIEIDRLLLEDNQDKIDVLIKGIKRNEKQIEETNKKINSLKDELKDNQLQISDLIEVEKRYNNWIQEYQKADLAERKVMISQLVNKIIFYKDGVDLEIKLPLKNSTTIQNVVGENDQHSKSKSVGYTQLITGQSLPFSIIKIACKFTNIEGSELNGNEIPIYRNDIMQELRI